jgi:hypothetical protein
MIKVTVELLPFGSKKAKKLLGVMTIFNNGTGDKETGNYEFSISTRDDFGQPQELKDFKRSEGFWRLIQECLNKSHQSME